MSRRRKGIIVAFNPHSRHLVQADDTVIPVTNYFGHDGEDVEDHKRAFMLVAGDDEGGWITLEMALVRTLDMVH